MQTNLFGSAFPLYEEGIQRLEQFEFSDAVDLIRQAQELHPELPNAPAHLGVAELARVNGWSAGTTAQELAAFWETLHQEQAYEGRTTSQRRMVFKLLAKRLLKLADFDADGLVPDSSPPLHISACNLHAGNHQAAMQALLRVLDTRKRRLPSRYWGYLGDVASAMRRAREANMGYLLLLAIDPYDTDWTTFRHAALELLFHRLQGSGDLQTAYGSWAFYAWADGILEVAPGNHYIYPLLLQKIRQIDPEVPLNTMERLQQFSLFVMYERSRPDQGPDPDMRQRMRELDGELFSKYLRICADTATTAPPKYRRR